MRVLILSDLILGANFVFSQRFLDLLNTSDKVIFNLEGSPQLIQQSLNYESQIMPFEVDKLINFISQYNSEKFAIALANNHILDNGIIAFDYLISELKKNNIEFFGTIDNPYFVFKDVVFLNFVTAETVAKFSISKKRLNYLFYDTKTINNQIEELEKKFNKLVLYPHWGRDMDNRVFNTYSSKLKFNKKWKVFGHHPHVISGIKQDFIYSLGNTFIPHPYYFDKYPATHYGLAIDLDSEKFDYKIKITEVKALGKNYELDVYDFDRIPKEVEINNNNFSNFKRLFLSIFEFKGNSSDFIKLWTLQKLTSVFSLKYRMFNKK